VTTGTAERPDTRPDPRIAERRQRVSADRRFRLRRRIAAALVVASLVGLTWYVANSPVVDVDEVVINGVDDPARRAEVLAASGITLGDPLLFVSLDGTAAAVEQVPWVDTVRVTRSWNPGVVEVSVTNRPAIGAVADGDRWLLIDSSGRTVGTADDPAGLVVVGGVTPAPPGQRLAPVDLPLVGVLAALSEGVATRVAEVRPGSEGTVELVLRGSDVDGAVVVLGQPADLVPAEVATKVRTLANVLATVDLSCLATIDLRVSDTAVLTRGESCA